MATFRRSIASYRTIVVLVAAVAGGVAIFFTWQPVIASFFDDSVSYLLMAQAMSPFEAADPAVLEAARREEYPPLFPALLALTTGAFDWRIGHAVVAVCFALSVFFLGVLARAVSGSGRIAVAASAVYVLLPGTWLNVKGILSEFPFMAITFAALAYHRHRRDKLPDLRSSIALGLLLAAALLTRSIGIALIGAVAIADGMQWLRSRERARLRGLAIALAVPLAAGALWYAVRPTGGEDLYRQAWTLSYMATNASALKDAWLNALLIYWTEPWNATYLLACALGVVGAAATLLRAWRGESDGLYCALFAGLLLFWPFPGQFYRIAFPIVPLLVMNALWGTRQLLARGLGGTTAERWVPIAALLPIAVCSPPLVHFAGRASVAQQVDANHALSEIAEFYRMPDLQAATVTAAMQIGALQDMEHIRATTPASSRIMWVMPGYIALLADRHGAALERSASAEGLARQALAAGADFIYLGNVHPHDSALRGGSPVDEWAHARAFTSVVWERGRAGGDVYAVLLKVDRDKAHTAQ